MHGFVRSGDIVGDLFLPEPQKANGVGIVWCPGLPNSPNADDMATPLSDQGFVVLQARYPGSWQSYGQFGPKSSVQGVLSGLELLSNGRTVDLTTEREITWSINRLALVGNSYGGGVAVCALALSDLADRAVAFCPLLEPDRQNDDPSQVEDDLTTLYPYLKRCHENVFGGLDDSEWGNFLDGQSLFHPPTYLPKLQARPLLLIHGKNDQTIRPYHTQSFFEQLKDVGATKAECLLIDGVGHGKSLRAKTWEHWTNWLLQ